MVACPDHSKTDTMILDAEHVHAFTVESLAPILMAFGFVVEEVMNTPFSFVIKARKATPEEILKTA